MEALTPSLALRGDDFNNWEGDQCEFVRGEASAQVSCCSSQQPDEEPELTSNPHREAVYALASLRRRWPSESKSFAFSCIGAICGNQHCKDEISFLGRGWNGTLFSMGKETCIEYLQLYLVELLIQRGISTAHEAEVMPVVKYSLCVLASPHGLMRYRALRLLQAAARWWASVDDCSECLLPLELASQVSQSAARLLNDEELGVRHAAVGTCAAWAHPNDALLSNYVDMALSCALQCAEDLADHDLVAEDIALICKRCGGNTLAAGQLEMTLERLLVALCTAADIEAGHRTLGAAAVLARHLQTTGHGKKVLPKFGPLLDAILSAQDKLLRLHGPALEALDACLAAGAIPMPGPAVVPKLFHLLCGGISADWPALDDEAYSGVRLDSAQVYASVLCHLLVSVTRDQSGQGTTMWSARTSDGFYYSEMAVCAARRLLGVNPGSWLRLLTDPGLPAAPDNATEESCTAAATIIECLFRVVDADSRSRILIPALDGALSANGGSGRDLPRVKVLFWALRADAKTCMAFLGPANLLPRTYALFYAGFDYSSTVVSEGLFALAAVLQASRTAHAETNMLANLESALGNVLAQAARRILREFSPSRKRKRDEADGDRDICSTQLDDAALMLGKALNEEPQSRAAGLLSSLKPEEINTLAGLAKLQGLSH
eukprot:gnl/MRDRNA2_/MRDRNA2_142314_c0_seq1.p1 gnl/MRDRNA2_/MRDRNA2_142314_c0~~gnl/MRDRNA2_/MRDRNA2_142314_c0_seq1.p1  ORF type:complete len:737 (-),score=133.29 gnl/MRDRNA2_/MRDRNA2_142314_c0_seq1:9-1997(-)